MTHFPSRRSTRALSPAATLLPPRVAGLLALMLAACTGSIGGVEPPSGAAGASSSAGATSTPPPGDGTAGSVGAAGQSGGSSGSGGTVPPPPFEPAPAALRRLTSTQFRNGIRDLLGSTDADLGELDPDSWAGGFATIGAARVATSERGAEQYYNAIEGAVSAVFADAARRSSLIGCTAGVAANDACVRQYLTRIGRRAWRRPLSSEELDRLAAVSAAAAAELGSAEEGVRYATVALLASPSYLYRNESGVDDGSGRWRYTAYELASRLSFLLWDSIPDDLLLDAAANGTLATRDGLRREAERLLAAPAGRRSVGNFVSEWLRLDRIATQAKDAGLYPGYTPELQRAMVEDVRRTWEATAFDEKASALDVFVTRRAFVNAGLAAVYGLGATAVGAGGLSEVTLADDNPHAGLLAKPAILSQFANQKDGSPTLRGKFVREALLCSPIPAPPPDVDTMLEDPPPGTVLTRRQQLERHRSDGACAACHSLMDPIGLTLENFDAIGAYRTLEGGVPIDASGEFDGTPIASAEELGRALNGSDAAASCMVRKFYAYGTGNEERPVDRSVIDALVSAFEASGHRLTDLVLEVVTHDAFSSVAPKAP